MKTPILETERIILRPLKVSDAQTIFNNWTSDPEVAKYMRWNTHKSVKETKEWLSYTRKNIKSDKMYDWGFILKETGIISGSGGLYYNEEYKMLEIGYCLMREHWGKGLATEAAKAMVDFALNELKQTKLYVKHAAENTASGRIIEKLGFVHSHDGKYKSFDGERVSKSREYFLEA